MNRYNENVASCTEGQFKVAGDLSIAYRAYSQQIVSISIT